MKINIKEIETNDVFSEESHYVVKKIDKEDVTFKHLETGKEVTLSNKYVEGCLNTSDQFTETKKVTKEDRKDGTPGIRTIFENIKSSEVFTVVFKEQDKPRTKKAIAEEKDALQKKVTEMIDKAKRCHTSMAKAYKEALQYVIDNPVSEVEEGKDRVLRGYKLQFVSRDGKYLCRDVDLDEIEDRMHGQRPVNINTISQLVVNGVKYIVEK